MGGGAASSMSPVLYEAVIIPTCEGVGVMGGGLLFAASFRLRFGVEGRSGVAKSGVGCAVATLERSPDFRVLLALFSELFLILTGLPVELTGRLTAFTGARKEATLVERLKDMLLMKRKIRFGARVTLLYHWIVDVSMTAFPGAVRPGTMVRLAHIHMRRLGRM